MRATMALDVKEVIQLAKRQFVELLPELELAPASQLPLRSKSLKNTKKLVETDLDSRANSIRLEELEKEGKNWAVTLSVPNPDFKPGDLLEGIRRARNLARVAKIFVIDGEAGTLIALRDRERAV
jgi:hypothetical protein